MKNMIMMVSVIAALGMMGCAVEGSQPDESEQSSDIIQPRSQVADNCSGGVQGVHRGACGDVIQPGGDVPAGAAVQVLGSPFTSSCDGNLWVAASFGSVSGDMRWSALCNFR